MNSICFRASSSTSVLAYNLNQGISKKDKVKRLQNTAWCVLACQRQLTEKGNLGGYDNFLPRIVKRLKVEKDFRMALALSIVCSEGEKEPLEEVLKWVHSSEDIVSLLETFEVKQDPFIQYLMMEGSLSEQEKEEKVNEYLKNCKADIQYQLNAVFCCIISGCLNPLTDFLPLHLPVRLQMLKIFEKQLLKAPLKISLKPKLENAEASRDLCFKGPKRKRECEKKSLKGFPDLKLNNNSQKELSANQEISKDRMHSAFKRVRKEIKVPSKEPSPRICSREVIESPWDKIFPHLSPTHLIQGVDEVMPPSGIDLKKSEGVKLEGEVKFECESASFNFQDFKGDLDSEVIESPCDKTFPHLSPTDLIQRVDEVMPPVLDRDLIEAAKALIEFSQVQPVSDLDSLWRRVDPYVKEMQDCVDNFNQAASLFYNTDLCKLETFSFKEVVQVYFEKLINSLDSYEPPQKLFQKMRQSLLDQHIAMFLYTVALGNRKQALELSSMIQLFTADQRRESMTTLLSENPALEGLWQGIKNSWHPLFPSGTHPNPSEGAALDTLISRLSGEILTKKQPVFIDPKKGMPFLRLLNKSVGNRITSFFRSTIQDYSSNETLVWFRNSPRWRDIQDQLRRPYEPKDEFLKAHFEYFQQRVDFLNPENVAFSSNLKEYFSFSPSWNRVIQQARKTINYVKQLSRELIQTRIKNKERVNSLLSPFENEVITYLDNLFVKCAWPHLREAVESVITPEDIEVDFFNTAGKPLAETARKLTREKKEREKREREERDKGSASLVL